MTELVIPAAEGRAFRVRRGERIRLATPKGRQAADFFAFDAADPGEWLSPMHTWVWSRSLRPRPGDAFLSQRRRPLLDFLEDGADGVHDMLLAACDQARYEQLGHAGPHRSCSDNLREAMRAVGREVAVVPQPVNFFTHTRVEPDGSIVSPPNPVPPGAWVVLRARTDLLCAVSSCPFDLALPWWPINAEGGPTELLVEVLPGA